MEYKIVIIDGKSKIDLFAETTYDNKNLQILKKRIDLQDRSMGLFELVEYKKNFLTLRHKR